MTGRGGRAVAAAVGLLLIGGCDSSGGKEEQLETRNKAEVVSLARTQADQIAELTGGTVANWRTSTSACEGANGENADDGRWSLSGIGGVTLPADRHVAGFRAVRDAWQSSGWEIGDYRTLSDGVRTVLDGRDPATRLSVSLTSSKDASQIAVIMGSACYSSAQGEDPANDDT
ncbi:hypothetical protein ACWKSP_04135 [Micromonosporaceae bacterium Da 78-11]